ncbi:hypothetical protein NDU88_004729 [Pleurodeles waltl]|uniref:Uncharacterized protein n=1 Tax=Pleurodeles waltl TaxID=8319 RepID=A0AAV7M755_PLEWA|nr:hypothetical protein NDU88_004729 [Pleurodeles waltl]
MNGLYAVRAEIINTPRRREKSGNECAFFCPPPSKFPFSGFILLLSGRAARVNSKGLSLPQRCPGHRLLAFYIPRAAGKPKPCICHVKCSPGELRRSLPSHFHTREKIGLVQHICKQRATSCASSQDHEGRDLQLFYQRGISTLVTKISVCHSALHTSFSFVYACWPQRLDEPTGRNQAPLFMAFGEKVLAA